MHPTLLLPIAVLVVAAAATLFVRTRARVAAVAAEHEAAVA
jgi:hypothetical protein